MHLNIKSDEAHRLAVELAAMRGETLTAAVMVALDAELTRERHRRGAGQRAQRLLDIGSRYAALPDVVGATADEILGYDATGAPG